MYASMRYWSDHQFYFGDLVSHGLNLSYKGHRGYFVGALFIDTVLPALIVKIIIIIISLQ